MLVLVGIISTLGVSGLCLTPNPNDDIFASFSDDYSPTQMHNSVQSLGLKILESDDELLHVVVANPKGDAHLRLRKAGAQFILKAKFAQFCIDQTPSKKEAI